MTDALTAAREVLEQWDTLPVSMTYREGKLAEALRAAIAEVDRQAAEIEALNEREQQSCGCKFENQECVAPCLYHHQISAACGRLAAEVDRLQSRIHEMEITVPHSTIIGLREEVDRLTAEREQPNEQKTAPKHTQLASRLRRIAAGEWALAGDEWALVRAAEIIEQDPYS